MAGNRGTSLYMRVGERGEVDTHSVNEVSTHLYSLYSLFLSLGSTKGSIFSFPTEDLFRLFFLVFPLLVASTPQEEKNRIFIDDQTVGSRGSGDIDP